MKATKNIHTFGDLILHLESLEMLDMSYTVEKIVIESEGEPAFSWVVHYEQGADLPMAGAIINEIL